jgi:heat shock protein HslJ
VWELKAFRGPSGSLVAPTANSGQGTLAEFDGRQMRGNIGCNFYEARYLVHGTRLALSRPVPTLVACGLNDEEDEYRQALMRVARYAIGQGSL